MAKTIQDQLAERIKTKFPEAEVKKVNKDNFLDIHLPGVHPKRGTHLFFNTSGGSIKVGFYCREEEFTKQVLAKSTDLEAYSQGIRPKGNPEWKTVDAAIGATLAFVESLSGKTKKAQTPPSKEAPKPKKEKPAPTNSKVEELSDFDLTEFDLEGRAVGRKDAPATPSQKEKETSEFDLNTFDLSTFGLEGDPAPKTPAAKAPKDAPKKTVLLGNSKKGDGAGARRGASAPPPRRPSLIRIPLAPCEYSRPYTRPLPAPLLSDQLIKRLSCSDLLLDKAP
jgi:hypothetical protein